MKCVGLIGGMSWQSSADYYKLINELVSQALGDLHSAHLVLYSVDFDTIERAQRQNRWDHAASMLSEAGRALKRAGADFLLLCTNTMHKVADAVEEASGLHLVHIADATGAAIRQASLTRVGLLGTRFTMEEDFYRVRLQDRFGVEVLVPPEKDRCDVHRIIYEELCHGRINASSRELYLAVMAGLIDRGAEGIVLGCTEIPLLIGPQDVDVSVFDTTRLHAEAAVALALRSGGGDRPY